MVDNMIRKPEPTMTKEELQKLREDADKQPFTKPTFDFSKDWNEIDQDTANAWGRKCEYITDQALRIIAKKNHISYSEIAGEVYLDPEVEWEATTEQVSDEDWIDATIQSFEDELEHLEYPILHEFRIVGIEAREFTVRSGSNTSARINVPAEWIGKKVMVVRVE